MLIHIQPFNDVINKNADLTHIQPFSYLITKISTNINSCSYVIAKNASAHPVV